MEAARLEPDNQLDTARTVPLVALGWGALTTWIAWHGHQGGWRPVWVYAPLVAVMGAGLLVLVWISVEGLLQYRALRHVVVNLDRPFLTIGELARLAVETGADARAALTADVHLEGREYTRSFVASNTAANTGGGWKVKERLVYRRHAGTTCIAEGSRLHNLAFTVPADIHPSVAEKPHGVNWTLRIRIKVGKAPVWDAKYPVKVRGRNGCGVNLNSKRQEFQLPEIADDPLPKLTASAF